MRCVLARVGDGSIIAQNRSQGAVVMVEAGCDDLPRERVEEQFSGYLSVAIQPGSHSRVRLRASYEHQKYSRGKHLDGFHCAPRCWFFIGIVNT